MDTQSTPKEQGYFPGVTPTELAAPYRDCSTHSTLALNTAKSLIAMSSVREHLQGEGALPAKLGEMVACNCIAEPAVA